MLCFVKEKFNRKKFLKGVDIAVITVYTVYKQLSGKPVAVSCMYMKIKSANTNTQPARIYIKSCLAAGIKGTIYPKLKCAYYVQV